ncbi:hypothetical protein [Vreelandella rituensis]
MRRENARLKEERDC